MMASKSRIPDETERVVRNLYMSGIPEEFIALQLDLEIPAVIRILKRLNVYKET